MKISIAIAALAISLLAVPAAAFAQQPHRPAHHGPVHVQKRHVQKPVVVKKVVVVKQSRWAAGRSLPSSYRRNVVGGYHRYHLRTPGRGQRWVRVDNQFLLINSITGVIAALAAAG
ncbi:RcnB family protein [Bosea sp. BK604]|uniref:RcnB family protein n=1 Tax=Bosea sp. BK604 TaxID=2512180 RepID=UPI001051088E|nr:RcnB family protein [Bosea sp. BK604]TCR61679.1 Ni/Co efflux regulator RcnB [Bosea sp. BK604]